EADHRDVDRQGQDRQKADAGREAAEDRQHRVARQHVGEQPDRQREGADEIGQQLDRHEQEEERNRYSLGHEQAQKMEPVLDDAYDRNADEDDRGQREGDDDVARHGKAVGNEPQQVAEQDEHEQREHEREELARAVAGIGVDQIGDE